MFDADYYLDSVLMHGEALNATHALCCDVVFSEWYFMDESFELQSSVVMVASKSGWSGVFCSKGRHIEMLSNTTFGFLFKGSFFFSKKFSLSFFWRLSAFYLIFSDDSSF